MNRFRRILKLLTLKLMIESELLNSITKKYKNNFSKGYTKNWSRELFIKLTYKIEDLNGENIIESFYEKKLLRSIL